MLVQLIGIVERNMFLMSPLSFFCYFTSLSKVFKLEICLCKNISDSLLSDFVLAMAPWTTEQQIGLALLVVETPKESSQ